MALITVYAKPVDPNGAFVQRLSRFHKQPCMSWMDVDAASTSVEDVVGWLRVYWTLDVMINMPPIRVYLANTWEEPDDDCMLTELLDDPTDTLCLLYSVGDDLVVHAKYKAYQAQHTSMLRNSPVHDIPLGTLFHDRNAARGLVLDAVTEEEEAAAVLLSAASMEDSSAASPSATPSLEPAAASPSATPSLEPSAASPSAAPSLVHPTGRTPASLLASTPGEGTASEEEEERAEEEEGTTSEEEEEGAEEEEGTALEEEEERAERVVHHAGARNGRGGWFLALPLDAVVSKKVVDMPTAPTTPLAPDASGYVPYRHDTLLLRKYEARGGRNCLMEAMMVATGLGIRDLKVNAALLEHVMALFRVSPSHGPSMGLLDEALRKCRSPFRLPKCPALNRDKKWTTLFRRTDGVYLVLAHVKYLEGPYAGTSDRHFVVYDAWRELFVVGPGHGVLRVQAEDKTDETKTREYLRTRYSINVPLLVTRLVVHAKRVSETLHNTLGW